jgi:hypothetical protein
MDLMLIKVQPSDIPGSAIRAAETGPDVEAALAPAIPFAVFVSNDSDRAVAFLGVRFDMVDDVGKNSSVVHYADTLRYPEAADFRPGKRRFICAEPAYTAFAMSGTAPERIDLDNLGRMRAIMAGIDCVVFADGEFAGPDRQGAYVRLVCERELEAAFLAELDSLAPDVRAAWLESIIRESQQRVTRAAARKILEGASFRLRIPVWRKGES